MTGHRKFSTLRTKMRERLQAEGKLTRTYKRREPGEVKDTTHVTRESLVLRHQYCITIKDIQREKANALKSGHRYDISDENIKGVCNHPEDGVCGADFTEDQVASVNSRLSGRAPQPDSENLDKESQPPRRRTRKSEKPPVQYFCLKCDKPHVEGAELYAKHIGNKRGRGRPKKK